MSLGYPCLTLKFALNHVKCDKYPPPPKKNTTKVVFKKKKKSKVGSKQYKH